MKDEDETIDFNELTRISITLYDRHIDFLKTINENVSLATRIVIDSIMKDQDRTKKREIFDGRLTFVSLGLIMFFISYLTVNFFVTATAILVGVGLLGYGLIGGILDALSRTRQKTTK